MDTKLKIMHEALAFYANPANYVDVTHWEGDPEMGTPKAVPVDRTQDGSPCDCGDRARAALAAAATPLRPEVIEFATVMDAKLDKKAAEFDDAYKTMEPLDLWKEMDHHAGKLLVRINKWNRHTTLDTELSARAEVLQAAADIGNFAMMIAYSVNALQTEPKREELCEDEGCPHHGTPHVCRSVREPALKDLQVTEKQFAELRTAIMGIADKVLAEFVRNNPPKPVLAIPCPTCSGTRTTTTDDRHTETVKDICPTCKDTGVIDPKPGTSPDTAYNPKTGQAGV